MHKPSIVGPPPLEPTKSTQNPQTNNKEVLDLAERRVTMLAEVPVMERGCHGIQGHAPWTPCFAVWILRCQALPKKQVAVAANHRNTCAAFPRPMPQQPRSADMVSAKSLAFQVLQWQQARLPPGFRLQECRRELAEPPHGAVMPAMLSQSVCQFSPVTPGLNERRPGLRGVSCANGQPEEGSASGGGGGVARF